MFAIAHTFTLQAPEVRGRLDRRAERSRRAGLHVQRLPRRAQDTADARAAEPHEVPGGQKGLKRRDRALLPPRARVPAGRGPGAAQPRRARQDARLTHAGRGGGGGRGQWRRPAAAAAAGELKPRAARQGPAAALPRRRRRPRARAAPGAHRDGAPVPDAQPQRYGQAVQLHRWNLHRRAYCVASRRRYCIIDHLSNNLVTV